MNTKKQKMGIMEMEYRQAEYIIRTIIKKYIQSEKVDTLACRFGVKNAKKVMDPNFPPANILQELIAGYQDTIDNNGFETVDLRGKINTINNRLKIIFLQQYLEEDREQNHKTTV